MTVNGFPSTNVSTFGTNLGYSPSKAGDLCEVVWGLGGNVLPAPDNRLLSDSLSHHDDQGADMKL